MLQGIILLNKWKYSWGHKMDFLLHCLLCTEFDLVNGNKGVLLYMSDPIMKHHFYDQQEVCVCMCV